MITDPFTAAAKGVADREFPDGDYERSGNPERIAFQAGAEWARDYLLAQEPTDAGPCELGEGAPIRNLGYYRSSIRCTCGYEVIWGEHDGDAGLDEAWRVHLMRSNVSAARAARRDEENR